MPKASVIDQTSKCIKTYVFVDEKFTVNAEMNRRNFLVIAYNPSDISTIFGTMNPISVMVSGAMVSVGSVKDPHVIEFGLKIGTK